MSPHRMKFLTKWLENLINSSFDQQSHCEVTMTKPVCHLRVGKWTCLKNAPINVWVTCTYSTVQILNPSLSKKPQGSKLELSLDMHNISFETFKPSFEIFVFDLR